MATTPDTRDALRPRAVDYLAMLLGALGISTAPVLVILSQAHPTAVGVWRFIYALPLLLPLCLLRRSSRLAFRRRGWMAIAGLSGLFFAADLALWHHSIGLIGAGPATLLANTQIIWIALIGLFFLGEQPSRVFWLFLPLTLLGMFLLVGGGVAGIPHTADQRGLVLGVGSGIAYAGMLVCLRLAQRRAPIPPESALLVQVSLALAALTLIGRAEHSLPASLAVEQHVWLALLGIGVQFGCWLLISGGIRRLPGHHGGMLLLAQPVGSLVLAWWLLDQALTASRIAGALLVLIGVAVPLLREARSR